MSAPSLNVKHFNISDHVNGSVASEGLVLEVDLLELRASDLDWAMARRHGKSISESAEPDGCSPPAVVKVLSDPTEDLL